MSLGLPSIGLVLFAFMLAAGQILFKLAATRAPEVSQLRDVGAMFAEPILWVALVLYGAATVLWVVLLQRVPLSYAYPFAALAFVIVPVAAALILNERLTAMFFVGAALIVAGVWLCAQAATS